MRFGELPLAEAEGAILAHSVRAGKLVYKKGRRLDAADVAALRRPGARSVIAARLGPDDVHEDEAARLVAAAAAGPHLRVEQAVHRAGSTCSPSSPGWWCSIAPGSTA